MKTKLCVCQSVTLEHMVTCVMKIVGTVKIRPIVTIVTERVWLDVWLAFKVPCVKHVSMFNIASIFIQKYAFDLFDFFYSATVIGLKYCRQRDFWRETLSNHSIYYWLQHDFDNIWLIYFKFEYSRIRVL